MIANSTKLPSSQLLRLGRKRKLDILEEWNQRDGKSIYGKTSLYFYKYHSVSSYKCDIHNQMSDLNEF